MKVAELTGEKLNEWVARSLGMRLTNWGGRVVLDTFGDDHLSPPPDFQGDWSQGGPLIEERKIELEFDDPGWSATHPPSKTSEYHQRLAGDTPLQAVCRIIVASVYGQEVPEVET